MWSSTANFLPLNRRTSNHVGIFFRLQENALFRQSGRQTTLLLRLGAGSAPSGGAGAESGTGALARRSGAPDRRGRRAFEPGQEAASYSHLRRSATVAASGLGATPAAVELRHGLLALSHPAAHRPASAASNPIAADARSAAPAHRR